MPSHTHARAHARHVHAVLCRLTRRRRTGRCADPAELYHQFHDDFMGPPYGRAYNALNPSLYKAGVLKTTGCPEMN